MGNFSDSGDQGSKDRYTKKVELSGASPKDSDELLNLYKQLSKINRILHYFSNSKLSLFRIPSTSQWQDILYDLNRISELYEGWNTSFPLSLNSMNCLDVKKDIAALRSIIKIKCKQAEQHWSQQQIKLFADLRCDNYTDNLASFIDSSLERTKRKIVLDRVLINSNHNTPILLTEGKDIKKAINEHFQNFVPISSIVTSLDNMPDRWKSCYDPLTCVDSQIYDTLMSLP